MGYRYDIRHLSPQAQSIIRARDEEEEQLKSQSISTSTSRARTSVHPISIFMRLGINPSVGINGISTLDIYKEFCSKNNSVWFSTDSLAYGIAKKQQKEFINAIQKGHIVFIYFVIGKKGGGENEIGFRAEVTDIQSNNVGLKSPDTSLTPTEWINDTKKIWIKIRNLKEYTQLSVSDFVVVRSYNVLADSIKDSQYHFGYIQKKT